MDRVAFPGPGGHLAEASATLIAGVRNLAPAWARRRATELTAAWGGLSPEEMAATIEAAGKSGQAAGARVADELEQLFAQDPGGQRATPLEIVRSVGRELTEVLAGVGLPEVVRDEFAESAWPDDPYDLVPRTFRDLDADLAAVHFAWGLAKVQLLRARDANSGVGD